MFYLFLLTAPKFNMDDFLRDRKVPEAAIQRLVDEKVTETHVVLISHLIKYRKQRKSYTNPFR